MNDKQSCTTVTGSSFRALQDGWETLKLGWKQLELAVWEGGRVAL